MRRPIRYKKLKPRKRNDLIILKGRTIGDLYVIKKVHSTKYKRPRWRCECSCGKRITVSHQCLIRKNPKSHCGCKNKGLPSLFVKEYHAWHDAKSRCHLDYHPMYPFYGAHGIQMCLEWRNSFEVFLKHIGPRPSSLFSLDRINPFGNYEPGNVRWATIKQQARNKKKTKFVIHPETGERLPAAQIAESLGMRYQTFRKIMIERGEW